MFNDDNEMFWDSLKEQGDYLELAAAIALLRRVVDTAQEIAIDSTVPEGCEISYELVEDIRLYLQSKREEVK